MAHDAEPAVTRELAPPPPPQPSTPDLLAELVRSFRSLPLHSLPPSLALPPPSDGVSGQSMFDGVADVEAQMVLHYLEVAERVKVARCSRRMMALVAQPLAWRFAPPLIRRVSSTLELEQVHRQCHTALLRHAPVTLALEVRGETSNKKKHPSAVSLSMDLTAEALLGAADNLVGLTLDKHVEFTEEQWLGLLRHPRASRLLTLANGRRSRWTSAVLRAIVSLPSLTHLGMMFQEEDIAVFTEASSLPPKLTSLRLHASVLLPRFHREDWLFPALDRLSRSVELRRLELVNICMDTSCTGEDFARLCGLQVLRRLRELELVYPIDPMMRLTGPQWAAGLRQLTALRALRLQGVTNVDVLLRQLPASLPSLETLTLVCLPGFEMEAHSHLHPSVEVLHELVHGMPRLDVQVLLLPQAEWKESYHVQQRRGLLAAVGLPRVVVKGDRSLQRAIDM